MAWLGKDVFRACVLLRWLVTRVKGAVLVDVTVLDAHQLLVTVLCILLVEVVDDTLLHSDLVLTLTSDSLRCGNLDVNL